MNTQDDPVSVFRRLHSSGCFVMPNPWDAGSARALEQLGFQALATTSSGFAWTLGRPDYQVSLDQALEYLDNDRAFLTKGGVFTDAYLDAYIELKMQEVTRFRMTSHPVEFDMYYSL